MEPFTRRGNLESSRSQESQLRVGLVALAMALVVAAFLGPNGLGMAGRGEHPALWLVYRGAVFVPFFVAAYGILAAFYKTCGISAIAGHRRTADGTEPVADRAELAAQRRMGAMVVALSGVLAAAATALFVLAA